MYSPTRVQKNLVRASKLIQQERGLPRGWRLRRSSPEEIQEMREYLDALVRPVKGKKKLIRDLSPEEELWILNELTLCKLDFSYFCANYVRIVDENSKVVPFNLRLPQRIIFEEMGKAEDEGTAIMFIYLKARQLGITTFFQAALAHRTFLYRNITAITGSSAEPKSRKMVEKLEFIYEQLPWWLRPEMTNYRMGQLLQFEHLNSGLYVQWGNQKSDIGRGDTPTIAHLSEVATYENPESLIDAGLIRALHENPFALVALESTAEGIGNWFHKTWQTQTTLAAKGIARLQPVFLPWHVGRDIYPTPAYLKRRPIPEEWNPPENVKAHARACASYVHSTDILTRHLGKDWQLPIEQQWFYHLSYEEARMMDQVGLFLQEMPATPEEAFQHSNPSIFTHEQIHILSSTAQAAIPRDVYEIGGKDISAIYDRYPRDRSLAPLSVRCLKPNGQEVTRFGLHPLVRAGWPDTSPDGKIFIWEPPLAGETYGIGVDPAEGVGQDSSVIQVIKKATPDHPDVQVAEFASNLVGPHDLWAWVYALANLYTTRDHRGRWNYPKVVIEINIAAGDATQTEMIKRGWPSFHQQIDMVKAKSASRVRPDMGWKTTRSSRPKLVSLARTHIRDGLVVIRSPWLVSELSTLSYNIDRQRIEAAAGSHDDRFMALAILLCSWYDPDLYGTAPPAWKAKKQKEEEDAFQPAYTSDLVIGPQTGHFLPVIRRSDSRSAYAKLGFPK